MAASKSNPGGVDIALAPPTVARLRSAHQQMLGAEKAYHDLLLIALEAMGHTGRVVAVDLQDGVVSIEPTVREIKADA